MQRHLGKTTTAIFPIGLGCMGMSEFYGASEDSASLALLAQALELGVNFFDTADTYSLGHNESLLGQFINAGGSARREQVVLATKFGIVREPNKDERRIDNSPAYIKIACEASLQRLGVDSIDLYYCHRRNPDVPIEELTDAMSDLITAGKVRHLGLSEVSANTLRKACAIHPIAAVQSEYSLWAREPEQEMLSTCAKLGTTFMAYSPLGRAFLTGTVDTSHLAVNDFRKNLPRFNGDAEKTNQQLVAELHHFAQAKAMSNAQVALAWLLNKYPNVVPISGTRRLPYLEQNVAAAQCSLTAAEITELDNIFNPKRIVGARYPDAGMVGIE